jgi:glutamate transport system ATP-binding protein
VPLCPVCGEDNPERARFCLGCGRLLAAPAPPHATPAKAGPPILEVRGVHKSFGDQTVLRGIDLSVGRGEVIVILGASGSGKSTLLRCVNALEPVDAGEVVFDGVSIHALPPRALPPVRAEMGFVFQQFNLFPHRTALQNITLGPVKAKDLPSEEVESRARELLDRVGIPGKAGAYPAELSGGQQQRVAIARALAMEPKLMMFDEPTSALDPEMIKEVLDVMMDLAGDGMTMLVVTHEMGFARAVANRIAFIDEGTIVEEASPADFFESASSPRTREFLSKILTH